MLGQRVVGHAHKRFAYTKQAVFADIRGIPSLGQQSGTLVLQPGQAAGEAVYADFGADFFGAEGSLLTDINTRRERIAKLYAQPVNGLPCIEVAAGAQRRDALSPMAEQKVCRAAGNMEHQRLLIEQLRLACGVQRRR